ncbi:peroxide stress protein YaaA [uncultured Gimesia sp.]|uniref:peroxide stress protein YaaA n=1 Tax=uncultured Gimesia sp. TaxID=1678688 RepID=UPI0030DBA67B|tara:strand:+ start:300940 stop:301731 length:792 start_codon:yes stop_codon:yes gene_type:complete
MLTVLSPAKSLNLEPQTQTSKFSTPEFLDQAETLAKKLKRMSKKSLSELMGISNDLAELNHGRFNQWSRPFSTDNAKQALLIFNGDVYQGLDAKRFKARDLAFAQDHLRILSGLYGVLRPLDLMQAYRLEMGTSLITRSGKSLYDFWGDKITESLNHDLAKHKQKALVNLASNEYFKSVRPRGLVGPVITPVFKEIKDGKSRTIALFAKQARGRMAAWMIQNRIDAPEQLTEFNLNGYEYQADESSADKLTFSRPQPPPVGKK